MFVTENDDMYRPSCGIRRRHRFWHATLKIAYCHTSTSSSTEGGSESNLLPWEHKMVASQILLDGAEPRYAGTPWLSSPVHRRVG